MDWTRKKSRLSMLVIRYVLCQLPRLMSALTLVSFPLHCKIERLDEALTNLGISEIGFLKLDVEGFEPAVVQGGKNLLSTGLVRFVYSEIIPKALHEAGYT